MSIYLTGDCHGQLQSPKLHNSNFGKDDFVIVTGDMGLMWLYNYPNNRHIAINELNKFSDSIKYTLLFVDGNHDQHDYLDSLPVEKWNGGNVSFLKENIIHLKRGQIFTINGKTFFTMGGAVSIDKHIRTEGVNWWRQEIPNYKDMVTGLDNLEKYANKVDYIITHEIPTSYKQMLQSEGYISSVMSNCVDQYLQEIVKEVEFTHMYAGHYHYDVTFDKLSILYNSIEKI